VAGWLKDWAARGLETVSFHGFGEPLSAPGFPRALQAASESGLSVELTTNGQLLDKYAVLISQSVTRLSVSLDTVDSAQARVLRPGIELEAVLRGVDAAREADVPHLSVWATLTSPMLESLPATLRWAARAQVDEVTIQPLGGPAARGPLALPRARAEAELQGALELAESLGVNLNIRRVSSRRSVSCAAPACTVCLRIRNSHSAYLFPCCNWNPRMPIGVIAHGHELEQLWVSDGFQEVVETVAQGRRAAGCGGCPVFAMPE
jgi:molybdenum cofactor biosynthesis enzyme MoaA